MLPVSARLSMPSGERVAGVESLFPWAYHLSLSAAANIKGRLTVLNRARCGVEVGGYRGVRPCHHAQA
jgi:hypothetical protein